MYDVPTSHPPRGSRQKQMEVLASDASSDCYSMHSALAGMFSLDACIPFWAALHAFFGCRSKMPLAPPQSPARYGGGKPSASVQTTGTGRRQIVLVIHKRWWAKCPGPASLFMSCLC